MQLKHCPLPNTTQLKGWKLKEDIKTNRWPQIPKLIHVRNEPFQMTEKIQTQGHVVVVGGGFWKGINCNGYQSLVPV